MGSSLRRQLREALPASIKGLQRAIALEIADDARYSDGWTYDPERGRCSKARLADLARWTGAKDELTVREMLRRMAVAGWEFRVPIGIGKDGRPLFAVPGHAMQFRVPDFEGPEGLVAALEASTEGPTLVVEGPTVVAEGPTLVVPDPTTVGSPSQVLPPTSHKASPTTSLAEVVDESPAVAPEVTDGGGGGSDLRSLAVEITAALDYRGKPPGKVKRQEIEDGLVAALGDGWTVEELAGHLDLGAALVNFPPAVYAYRLSREVLLAARAEMVKRAARGGVRGPMPTAADYESLTVDDVLGGGRRDAADGGMWERTMARARKKTAALAGGHQPYQNPPDDSVYDEPWTVPPPRPSWCGEPECSETDRMRDGQDENGLPHVYRCPRCHPDRVRAA